MKYGWELCWHMGEKHFRQSDHKDNCNSQPQRWPLKTLACWYPFPVESSPHWIELTCKPMEHCANDSVNPQVMLSKALQIPPHSLWGTWVAMLWGHSINSMRGEVGAYMLLSCVYIQPESAASYQQPVLTCQPYMQGILESDPQTFRDCSMSYIFTAVSWEIPQPEPCS